MSNFVEDMVTTPEPAAVDAAMQMPRFADPYMFEPTHGSPSESDTSSVSTGESVDSQFTMVAAPLPYTKDQGEDEDADIGGLAKSSPSPAPTPLPAQPSPAPSLQPPGSASQLSNRHLRASRLPRALHGLFGIDKRLPLSATLPPASPFLSPLPAPKSAAPTLRADDLRQSKLPSKLDGVFGLAQKQEAVKEEEEDIKGVHWKETPEMHVYEMDSETSTLASEPSSPNTRRRGVFMPMDLRSAFSLSPSSPGGKEEKDKDLVTWGAEDVENPHTWTTVEKWKMTMVVGFMTLNATFASSAPSAGVPRIAEDFGVSMQAAELTTSIFLVGYIFGPAFWGPGSEILGRRGVLILAMFLFCASTIGQPLAPNFGVFVGTRLLAGFFAVAPLVNGGGIVADIWDPATRGLATTVFSTMIFFGPVLGAVIGGIIIPSYLGYRWVFWVIAIFAGCSTLLAIFVLPETHAPTLQVQKARRLRTILPARFGNKYAAAEREHFTPRALLERTLFRPFTMLFREPILLLVTLYVSVVYGCLYALFEGFPIIFTMTRDFTVTQTGLIFLFVGSGALLATIVDFWQLRGQDKLLAEWKGNPPPERRLLGAMIAGPSLVVAIFWLGWSGQFASVHWIVPALSSVLIGFTISLVFNSFMGYLVDTYLQHTASAFAALTIIRSLVGAAFPLFTTEFFLAIGVGPACSVIGAVGILLAPLPFVFYRYGARIRARSQFAPGLDLKLKAMREAQGGAVGSV